MNKKLRKFASEMLLMAALLFAGGGVLPLRAEPPQGSKIAVSGVVSDADDIIIGASVTEKGNPANGVATDIDGKFTLQVPANATLAVSYLGYTTQEIAVDGQSTINVTLSTDLTMLDEVVVTALGIKRDTRALGYAVSTVKGDDLIKSGVTANPIAALYGKSAGVGVQSTSGGPMGGMSIKIRGAASMNPDQSVRPLFVVDGVPISDKESGMSRSAVDYGSGVNDINPDDIASMEILKGAKASVLYGEKGANGVVLITTKSGSAGRKGIGIDVSFSHEWEKPYSSIDFQNEYGSGINEYDIEYDAVTGERKMKTTESYNFGPKFDGSSILYFDGSTRPYQAYENNYMDFFQDGASNNVSVAITSAGDKGNSRVAYTHYDYGGTMPNQTLTKNTLSFNGSYKASDKLTFDFTENLYLTEAKNRRPSIERFLYNGTLNRDFDMKTAMTGYKDPETGYRYDSNELKEQGYPIAFSDAQGLYDILWNNSENSAIDAKHHSITAVKATLQFLPTMALKVSGGLDYTSTDFTNKSKVMRPNKLDPTKWDGGGFSFSNEQTLVQNYEGLLTFDKPTIYQKLDVFAFVGGSYRRDETRKVGVGTYGNFLYPDYWSVSNMDGWGRSPDSRIASYSSGADLTYSVFGQATFSWDRTYYLEFQARNDWSSTLPKANRSYFYPGVSFTYNFTENIEIPTVNYGKFRLSWADVGRPAPRYYALNNYTSSYNHDAQISEANSSSYYISGDLKAERKREIETGFNVKMFEQDRMEVDFSYYNNTVYNQIMSVNVSASSGKPYMKINAGEVSNNGVEVLLKVAPVIASNYRWDWTFTFARQWDEVVALYHGDDAKSSITANTRSPRNGVTVTDKEGEPMGQMYMYDFEKDPATGQRIVNSAGLYTISTQDKICVGNINPDLFGGISTNFGMQGKWGAADLSAGFDYRVGGEMVSYSNYNLKAFGLSMETLKYRDAAHGGLTYTDDSGRERHDGLILPGVKNVGTADAPVYEENKQIIAAYAYYRSFGQGNTAWPDEIKTNNYLKLREVSLSYTLPKSVTDAMKVQKLSVGLTARNLFYLYKSIPNIDPESVLGTSSGNNWVENSAYPSSRTFGFNVKLSF
ncbi:SusC/RagA family TonB-linked outer membrane protein [Bacteroidia bacterium]|nr:SusC/RagA family TonB-linked outer membrane protein [Bacteroidia bacterium]